MDRRNSKTLVALLALTMSSALTLAGCGAAEEAEPPVVEKTSTPEVSRVLADPYIPSFFPFELPKGEDVVSVFSTLPTSNVGADTHTCISFDGDATEAMAQLVSEHDFTEIDTETYEDLYSFQQKYTNETINIQVALTHSDKDGHRDTSICAWYGKEQFFTFDPVTYIEHFPTLPEPKLDFTETGFQENQEMEGGKLTVRHELDLGASTPVPAVQEYGKQYLNDLIAAGWESNGISVDSEGNEMAEASSGGLTVRFDFREDRPDQLLRFDWNTDTVLMPEIIEKSTEAAEPEPATPAWEDLAGTWCSDEMGCITINPDIATGTWGNSPATLESKTERDGCFSFYLIYGGGTAFTACMAGTPSPGVGTNGAPLGEGDESQDRIYPDAQAGPAPETMYRQ